MDPLLLVAGDDGVVDLWRLPPREDKTLAVPTATTAAPWDTVPIGTTSHRTVSAVGFWPRSPDIWSASPGGLKRWAGVEPPYSAVENKLGYKRGSRGIRAAEVSADGRLAVSGGGSNSYTWAWDLSGATPAHHPLGVEAAVGILPDGRSFVTVTEEATGGRPPLVDVAGRQTRPRPTGVAGPLVPPWSSPRTRTGKPYSSARSWANRPASAMRQRANSSSRSPTRSPSPPSPFTPPGRSPRPAAATGACASGRCPTAVPSADLSSTPTA